MALSAAFTTYLLDRSGKGAGSLASELTAAGYALESAAVRRFQDGGAHWFALEKAHGLWAGRRCWIGSCPPQAPQAGDLWMDTVEVTPMILTPGEAPDPNESYTAEALARFLPFRGWIALRPAARWQFAAFLDLAPLARWPVLVHPPLPLFDRARILRGLETDPVTRVLADEAILYANWFSKVLCGRYEWQALGRLLPADRLAAVWSPTRREWVGRFSEGVNAAVSPETIDLDWTDEFDRESDEPGSRRIFYGEWEAPADVAFRTAIRWDTGLLRRPVDDSSSPLDVQLSGILAR